MEFKVTQDEMFQKMQKETGCKSLMKKYLTPEAYEACKNNRTKLGGTVAHCINTGYEQLDSSVGIMASDPEAYEQFAAILDNVIKDYHKFPMDKPIKHPAPNFGDLNKLPFGNLDPSKDGKMIVSTRIRVGRSAAGFAYPPLLSDAARKEIEDKAKAAFATLPDEYKGKYFSLSSMTPAEQKQLTEDHFLFGDDDRFNKSAGVYRNWPHNRGIFHNPKKNFLVWVNEEDNLRIISMQMGGNLGEVYKRLVNGINLMEKQVPFAHSDRLGYLTFCPTNLGTTLRASVHAKIPKVAADAAFFKEICDKYNIQARGIHGEHTESVGGVYDLSNKRRLGLTEIDAVKEMAEGVTAILKKELSL